MQRNTPNTPKIRSFPVLFVFLQEYAEYAKKILKIRKIGDLKKNTQNMYSPLCWWLTSDTSFLVNTSQYILLIFLCSDIPIHPACIRMYWMYWMLIHHQCMISRDLLMILVILAICMAVVQVGPPTSLMILVICHAVRTRAPGPHVAASDTSMYGREIYDFKFLNMSYSVKWHNMT